MACERGRTGGGPAPVGRRGGGGAPRSAVAGATRPTGGWLLRGLRKGDYGAGRSRRSSLGRGGGLETVRHARAWRGALPAVGRHAAGIACGKVGPAGVRRRRPGGGDGQGGGSVPGRIPRLERGAGARPGGGATASHTRRGHGRRHRSRSCETSRAGDSPGGGARAADGGCHASSFVGRGFVSNTRAGPDQPAGARRRGRRPLGLYPERSPARGRPPGLAHGRRLRGRAGSSRLNRGGAHAGAPAGGQTGGTRGPSSLYTGGGVRLGPQPVRVRPAASAAPSSRQASRSARAASPMTLTGA